MFNKINTFHIERLQRGNKFIRCVSISAKLRDDLDKLRGQVPRSRLVEDALTDYVEAQRKINEEQKGVGSPRFPGAGTPSNATSATLDTGGLKYVR